MAVIVEDGTGKPDANSYGSLADANTYLAGYGRGDWVDGDDELKEPALRRGTTYIDGHYGTMFPGTRTHGREQALAWPRKNAKDVELNPIAEDSIPIEIINATFEAAYREFVAPYSLSPDYSSSRVQKRVSVGPISVEYETPESSGVGVVPVSTTIDDILSSLFTVTGSGGSGVVVKTIQRT
jgi:hypothetical protein